MFNLTHLFLQEDLVGAVDKTVHLDDVLPGSLTVVVLNDKDKDHERFDHQLPVLRLRDSVQHHLNLQRKLELARRHLEI